jgi:hypothetical protein
MGKIFDIVFVAPPRMNGSSSQRRTGQIAKGQKKAAN